MLINEIIRKIKLPEKGVNFWDATEELAEGEGLLTQNCFWRRGMVMKAGTSKHSSDQVVSNLPITGLHRFYYNTSDKTLLAACGTVVRSMNDSTGAWTDRKTGLTTGLQTYFTTWGALNRVYVANGTDTPFYLNSSLAETDLSPANSIDGTVMFCPYRDRLLSFDSTNPSYIRWSGSYDDSTWTSTAQAIRVPGSGGITSISLHSVENTSTGMDAMVLVTKPTSLYLFSGTNLDPTATDPATDYNLFNARLDPVSGGDGVGCVAPRTIVGTPKGTIFLGSDRQVYLLPYGSSRIVPIGHKIQSQLTSTILGIESCPVGQISKACAEYHKGFYKLSFAVTGGTTNTRQLWLDVDRLYQDAQGHFGPWYGPMVGIAISCMVVQNGSGDDGRLLGGNSASTGYVYRLNEPGIFSDDGTAIEMICQTRHEYLHSTGEDARVMETELEMTDPTGTVTLLLTDTTGPIATAYALSPESVGNYWGLSYWGEEYWEGGGLPVRRKIEWYDKYAVGRFLAGTLSYSSSTDAISIYTMQHKATPVGQTFQVRP